MYICKKITGTTEKEYKRIKAEFLHEIYFYENVINNNKQLNNCKLISYNVSECNLEAFYTKLKGYSLLDYLNSKNFSFEVFVKILYKISEKVYEFQKRCTYFMHNDLYPWNIILDGENIYIIDY